MIIQPAFYLIAACLPSLRPLLVEVLHRIRDRVSLVKASKRVPWSGSFGAASKRNAQFQPRNGTGSRRERDLFIASAALVRLVLQSIALSPAYQSVHTACLYTGQGHSRPSHLLYVTWWSAC